MGAATVTDLPDREAIDAAHEGQEGAENVPGRREQFEQEAGPAVTPAPKAPTVGGDVVPDEIVLQGQLPLEGLPAMGGKRPTSARLTITGVSGIEMSGGFKKGQHVYFEGVACVEETGERDKRDRKQNVVTACVYKQQAHATDLRVAPASGASLGSAEDALVRAVQAAWYALEDGDKVIALVEGELQELGR